MQDVAKMMTQYMAWANGVVMGSVDRIAPDEVTKTRPTLFKNMSHTFNHVAVIEDIFRAHLEGRSHDYTARNTEVERPWPEVKDRLRALDRYYVNLAESLTNEELSQRISFTFVGGGDGQMSRMEIILHLVNHATYHRGLISDMLYQVPYKTDNNDLTVFLRDVYPS